MASTVTQEIDELLMKLGSKADPRLLTSVRRIPIQSALEVCERDAWFERVSPELRSEVEALSRRCGLHRLG